MQKFLSSRCKGELSAEARVIEKAAHASGDPPAGKILGGTVGSFAGLVTVRFDYMDKLNKLAPQLHFRRVRIC